MEAADARVPRSSLEPPTMRVAFPMIALAIALLPGAVRATPARLDIIAPAIAPVSGRPFTFDIHREGDWDIDALKDEAIAYLHFPYAWIGVTVDGASLANLMLAYRGFDAGAGGEYWLLPEAWRVNVPGLAIGPHTIAVSYGGDAVNTPETAVLSFDVLPAISLEPPGKINKPLDPVPGAVPAGRPTGVVLLTDAVTNTVVARDIADLVLVDPDTGALTLDLAWVKGDTVVTFAGDANFAPFNFTYDTPEPIPAPGLAWPAALLALAFRRRRR